MKDVCYSCFQEKNEEGPCSHCGYDPKQDQGKYDHALPHGTVLAGMYVIGRVLGQGGFGITYGAQEYKSGKLLAVKEFYPDTMARRGSSNTVVPYAGERGRDFAYGKEMFLEEAKTLAQFQKNPNIVHIYTYFEENNTAYFAMEYMEGIDLRRYIEDHGGRLGWREARELLLPVMEALSAVHEKGLIHRDIKPENIMVTPAGTAKLLDFGSARYSLGEKSQSLDVVLTYGFSPWEQYSRHGKQGPYTDVYALAATFYYAVTGIVPPDSIDRVEKDDLVMPSKLGVKLPPQQEQALCGGLSVLPENRLQTIQALRSALYEGRKTILFQRTRWKKKSRRKGIGWTILRIANIIIVVVIGAVIITAIAQSITTQVSDRPCDSGSYSGDWCNGQPDGQGIMLFTNGDSYEGGWEYGKMSGTGTMDYADGSSYEGGWKWGDRSGQGTMVYANGDRYEGEWDFNQKEGMGTMVYANGDRYQGEWSLDGKKNGIMNYANGDSYEGSWSVEQRSGTGTMVYATGDRYEGEWLFGRESGNGEMTYANGDWAKGIWSGGTHDLGSCSVTYENGDHYEGEWAYGQREGAGTMEYANGDHYEGEWSLDQKTGTGSMVYANGESYEGEWSYDDRTGRGTYTFSDGTRITANWNQNRVIMDDTGVITKPDGTEYKAVWMDGKLQMEAYGS